MTPTPEGVPPKRFDMQRRMTTRCQSDDDGDCTWQHCPQNRDGEPTATGRHCPWDRPPHTSEGE